MSSESPSSVVSRLLITCAAVIVIIAGMRAAAPLLVPFLLALFIAIIIAPPLAWLQRRRVPGILAMLAVITGFLVFVVLLTLLVGSSVEDFMRNFPQYQTRLHESSAGLMAWLDRQGVAISPDFVSNFLDPAKAMKMVTGIISSMGGILTNGFLILITVIFLLMEGASLPAKWRAAFRHPEASLGQLRIIMEDINHYMGIKTLTSLATGLLVALWLWLLGVDYPLLWGALAFLFNFVPNIGSIIAAIPAVLLALIQLGVGPALLVVLGYVVVNVVIGTFLEPRYMGQGLGLSTLVVFLSLVFWGWVLGPVGMLLSVPLTITVKIALDSNDSTRWIAILLGSRVESERLTAMAGKGDSSS
ncbi:MAG: AI-2E family transporter [Gammaproteobacteria bacterium]